MKLLDPFAGYRLASGHAFFHVALFTGSWFVPVFGSDNMTSSTAIMNAFSVLRWGHFILFTLAIIEAFANNPSDIPSLEESADKEKNEEDEELTKYKIYHRDGSWKLLSRILATISVFVYQGAVFYAQKVLADEIVTCGYEDGSADEYFCKYEPLRGNNQVWLVIETLCFYLYVLAAVAYICWRQLYGSCCKNASAKSDMSKALNDFIEYATLNLTWFSFNFVLVCMPPILLYALDSPDLQISSRTQSYIPIMYTLWAMHLIHFAFQIRIYEISRDSKGQIFDSAQLDTGFNKDDHFKLQN